ncbi:MAG: branched-chain amino acid ABC transporter permease [Thermoanaerobacteraceae bacterium]|nr:branched-chain amino acid ABC transporter permease [Thermoanaerobacteraceae bacterium]
MFLQQLVNSIVIGSVYALTAMGATLVYGILRVLDIANAGAYAVGAYIGMAIYALTGNLFVSLIATLIISGAIGICLEKFIYLRLLDKPSIVPLITSIGVFIFIEDLLRLLNGPYAKRFPAKLPFSGIQLSSVSIPATWILVMVVTAVLLFILWYILYHTRIGLAWRATAQDMETAKAMGVNINLVVALNFLLGYGFAAVAGSLIGIMYNSISPTMGDTPAYKMLAIIVLGGLGNPVGTVLAALIIGLVETFLGGYIGFFLPRDAIAFVALIIMLLIRPKGLFASNNA